MALTQAQVKALTYQETSLWAAATVLREFRGKPDLAILVEQVAKEVRAEIEAAPPLKAHRRQ